MTTSWRRADGYAGWNNERVVAVANGWVVRHVPNGNGPTTLRRLT